MEFAVFPMTISPCRTLIGPQHDMSATIMLPERVELRARMSVIVGPIPRCFLGIARRGSAQIGAALNSKSAGHRFDPYRAHHNQPLAASTPLPTDPTVITCDIGLIRSRISTLSLRLSG